MSARIEQCLPFLVATIAAVVAACVVFVCELSALPVPVAAGTMTFGVVVAGFSATQRNVLMGTTGSRVMRLLVSSQYHEDIIRYFKHSVYGGLGVTFVSLLGFFLGDNATAWRLWLTVLTFCVVLVITLIFRNEILVLRVVKHLMETGSEDQDSGRR